MEIKFPEDMICRKKKHDVYGQIFSFSPELKYYFVKVSEHTNEIVSSNWKDNN